MYVDVGGLHLAVHGQLGNLGYLRRHVQSTPRAVVSTVTPLTPP